MTRRTLKSLITRGPRHCRRGCRGIGIKPRQSRWLSGLANDQRGATSLEWALLLGAIAIPSYFIFLAGLDALAGHYQMIVTLNALPFP